MQTLEKLLDHVEAISGERPYREETADADVLPLFLKDRYHFVRTRIFGARLLLAVEANDWEPGSAKEYHDQSDLLSSKLGRDVVLVLSRLPSYTRNRLVSAGVPFIVPGSQIFLPGTMIDLRERFTAGRPKSGEKLSATAQLLVLFQLQRGSIEGESLKELSVILGYSAMMISKVKDELEEAELCKVQRVSRSLTLKFPAEPRDLWQRAMPMLSSPVRKSRWVRWEQPDYPALTSGLTALSRRTMIEDDRLPTYAMQSKVVTQNLEIGTFSGCRDAHEATIKLEAWSYEPKLLADNNETVDPLSLYLSLCDSADDRVQGELNRMMEELGWSQD